MKVVLIFNPKYSPHLFSKVIQRLLTSTVIVLFAIGNQGDNLFRSNASEAVMENNVV